VAIDRSKVRSAAKKHYRNKNWQKAIREYQKLVEDDGDDLRSLLKVADLHNRLGNEDEAVQTYQRVGDHHAREDLYQKAVAVYKQALQLQPDAGDLQRKVGEAYYRLDRLRDAAEAFQRAQQCYEASGRRDAQIQVLERLVDLDPADVGLQIQLAECYARASRKQEALETFRRAAETLDEEGRVDDFLQVAKRILYFDPDDRQLRKTVIDLYLDRGDYKNALKHLHICFNANPDDLDILRPLAETFLKLDRTDKAILVFHQLASRQRERDRTRRARNVWNRILELDPSNEKARALLEQTKSAARDTERSAESSAAPRAESGGRRTEEPESASGGDDEGDALDDIEFIDEASESEPAPPEAASSDEATREEGGDDEFIDLSDNIVPVDDEPSEPSPPEVSDSTGEPPPVSEASSTTSGGSEPDGTQTDDPDDDQPRPSRAGAPGRHDLTEETRERLDEVDVFLKYGLHDKARDLLQQLVDDVPDHRAIYERRRQLYEDTGRNQAEAQTLVEMARLSETDPEQAETWLREARSKADDLDPVADAARELGIVLEGLHTPNRPDTGSAPPPPEEEAPTPIDPATDSEVVEVEPSDTDYPSDELESIDGDLEPVDTGTEGASEDDASEGFGFEASAPEGEFVEPAADGEAAEASGEIDLGFLEEEADRALDDLFDGVQKENEDEPVNVGGDDPSGEMAEIDFYIQQGLYDEAEHALEQFERDNPDHPGLEKRRYQIEMGRQGGQVEKNPTGAESLSREFHAEPDVEDEPTEPEPTEPSESDDDPERSDAPPLEAASDEAQSSLELGDAYFDMGLHDEATDEFEKALDDPVARPHAQYKMALCHKEQGEDREAADLLSELVHTADAPDELRTSARTELDDLQSQSA
jgi:tetratricopeptide (TPR) repeat protein